VPGLVGDRLQLLIREPVMQETEVCYGFAQSGQEELFGWRHWWLGFMDRIVRKVL
jgi:hypothetical protein